MQLDRELDGLSDLARNVLEDGLRKDRSYSPAIFAYRNNLRVAMVLPQWDAMGAARISAGGFAAEELALILDTYTSPDPINPSTGEYWKSGEMCQAVDNDNALALGWVIDALTVHMVTRAGDARLRSMPYRVRPGHVEWLPPIECMPTDIGGTIADKLRDYMTERFEGMPSETDEVVRAALDIATSALLFRETGATVALGADPDSVRAALIDQSMGAGLISIESYSNN